MNNSISIGMLTCNRKELFTRSIRSIVNYSKHLNPTYFVVNNGIDDVSDVFPENIEINYLHAPQNLGIAKAKNMLFRGFWSTRANYLFIIEDDIEVFSGCFEAYLGAHHKSKFEHLLFGMPEKHKPIKVDTKLGIAYYTFCVGAFCFYTRKLLTTIGIMDERFKNAFEHCDHSRRAVQSGFIRAEFEWPDIIDSIKYVKYLDFSGNNSLRKNQNSSELKFSSALYLKNYGRKMTEWEKI